MEVNKHKNLDQVFQEKLQNIEVNPPAQIWEGIQAGSVSSSNSWRWWAAAGIVTIILGVSSYFYFSSDALETEKSLSKQNNIESVETQIQESTTPEITSSENLENSEDVEQELIKEMNESLSVEDQIPTEEHITQLNSEIEIIQIEELSEITESEIEETILLAFDGESIDSQYGNIQFETYNPIPSISDEKNASKAGYDFFDEDATEDILQGHNEHKHWELGIEFSPEWISIPENDNNITNYGLDFSARYYFSKWFVETGLGASLSKDDGIYKVDTVSQYKGSYLDVYEVTFDESGSEPIPIYHTELKNVYENIDTNYVSRTKNDYIYLNIPLNIGYSTKLNDKFAVYFKGGIINSFKIYENIPDFETVDNSNNDIIHSEARYFNRTPWNMQAQLNVGMHYYLSDKLIFGVEPNARYYIKSLVEDNSGGNPYGFGVKIGFKYVIKK